MDYSSNTLLKIHKKYLGLDNVNYIIHRRAIHLLSQIFYSFDNYSRCDTSTSLSAIDTFQVFLFSNTILDIVEGQDFTSDLKIFYNSYKSSSDYINNFDLHNVFYFYIQFYKELKKSENYNSFNNIVLKEAKVSIDEFATQLEIMYLRKGTFNLEILKDNFEINCEDTLRYWNMRNPKTPIPFEYKVLSEKPFVKFQGNSYILLSQYFILLALAKKIYFVLRGLDAQKFGNEFGKIVEAVLTQYLRNSLENKICREINLKYDKNKEYADFGVVMDEIVFLFEIKSGMLSLAEKYEPDIEKFKERFDNKFVNKKGVVQQLNRLKEIHEDYKKFRKVTGLDENVKYRIIPILLFLDEEFFCTGFNQYIRSQFMDKKTELKIEIQNIRCARYNSSIVLSELKSSIDYLKEPQKILYSIYFYTIFFDVKDIGYHPYEFFTQEYFN